MRLASLFRDMPIRRKLTLITLLSAGAALLLASLVVAFHQWSTSHAELAEITHSQALIVARNSTSALLANDPKSAEQNLEALAAFDNIELAALYDRQGRLFARFVAAGQKAQPADFLTGNEPAHAHPDVDTHVDEHELTHTEHDFAAGYLGVTHAIVAGGERIGAIYVRSNLAPVHQKIMWSAVVMVVAALGGMGLALLLVAALHPAITGPIARLVGLMGVISSEKNYALRADAQGNDELGTLGREFNEMLAQIQARDTALAQHRSHLEQEVARRTASLSEAQRIAHLGSWEWDVVHDILNWSDEVYWIFGRTQQTFDGTYEAFMQSVHPDDRQRVEEEVRRAIEQGQAYSQDHRILLPDGSVRHVHEQGDVSFNEAGQAIRMVGTVQDITERKQLEINLQQRTAFFEALVATSADGILVVDSQGRKVLQNRRMIELFKIPEEIAAAPDDGPQLQFVIDQVVDSQQFGDRVRHLYAHPEERSLDEVVLKDGSTLDRYSAPVLDSEGHSFGRIWSFRDITERKLAAQALEESERKFRAIVDATVDGILVTDVQTRKFVIANRAICDMLGYPMEALYGLGVADIHPAEALAGVQKMFERQLKGEIRMAQNMPVKRKDGSVFFADVSASPIVLEGRTFMVGAFHDVTERMQAEEHIRDSEARYRNIFENANDIIFLLNADGTFHSMSPSVEWVAGWAAEEWIGKPFAPMVHADDLPVAHATLQKALAGETISNLGLRIAKKSGEYFSADLNIAPLSRDLIMGIARDVSERERAEMKIRTLNEELESKVKARTQQLLEAQEELVRKEKLAVLGQVAGSVGHELRNPLGVMSNAVYFLQIVLSDADETTKEYLNIIKSEIAGSERIVSDLLDSVRTKPPQPVAVTLAELIGQTLRKYTVPDSVAVNLDIPETLTPLQVDPQQIHQVFRNLISNGVEAMAEGGELEIRAVENRPDGTVTVSVRDSGIGMTPEQMARLFQPLFTTKARGIGLGMVVVKNLTEANGGKVDVQSELGRGTTVTITLPCVAQPVEEA
jgi:PAS domain S-box-containing protein